jgi:hypothetical protein
MVPYPYYTYPTGCYINQCRCTFTDCCCYANYWPTTYITVETKPPSKQEANKRRMESIPRRPPPTERMRIKAPPVRSSIQALSVRIR